MTIANVADIDARDRVDYARFAGGEPRVVPTTESQQEIWLADQLHREASLSFNISLTLRFRGRLDVEALRGALQDLVQRHDALRATIGPDGETLCLVERLDVPLIEIALEAMDDADRKAMLAERIRLSVETPFALSLGPLFRAELLHLAADEHVLLISSHHIVCDGWSRLVLVRELGTLYGRRCGIDGHALPAAPSYGDYALAEADRRAMDAYAEDEAYWLDRFAADVTALEFPADRPRPAVRSFASAWVDHFIDVPLMKDIKRFGAEQGGSLFTTLLTGFACWLAKITGQRDIVVGIPAANQPVSGLDGLVGHCANFLPLRFNVDPDKRFVDALGDAQTMLIDALEHQSYAFGTLLKKLRIKRDPSRVPLAAVMFNIDQPVEGELSSFPGLEMDLDSNPRSFDPFEMFVNVLPTSSGLRVECQYNRDLFDGDTIRGWLCAYEALLRAAVEHGGDAIGSLPMVDAAAFSQLALLQPESTRFDRELRMHEHFERQCDREPDRIAVRSQEGVLDYRGLEARANRIASLLRARGVRRGTLAGIALDRGGDMLAALLGVLKAGAGYVPLDPQFPSERLAYMVADAGLAALVTTRKYAANFDLRGRPVLALDVLAADMAAASSARCARDEGVIAAEDVAYVIYTSGSTGRPKGVRVPHRAVANFIAGMQREPGMSASDRLLAVTTLSFDIAVLELLLPLSVGAEVVMASRDVAADGAALLAMLKQTGATVLQATPSTWRMLLDAGWEGSQGLTALCGGEALARDLADQLLPRCRALWNMYGPTETTVWSTVARVEQGPGTGIHIGRPTANTSVWVIDPNGQLCPRGVSGEICIGGDGVTLGYWGRKELTDERFVEDRFSDHARRPRDARLPPPKLYRTGDRGRWRIDDNLEHLGRLDHQVKVRGFRIEPGEIEAALVAYEGVARAVVVVREDRTNDCRLVAYLVAKAGTNIVESNLRTRLREVLPVYMVPQHFIVLDALPLLPNGKLDRHALPAPATRPDAAVQTKVGGSRRDEMDPRASYLTTVWSELLGSPVGADNNFFEIGGHSMLAVQMVNRVHRDTGVRIKLIRLGTDTLAQIAADLPLNNGSVAKDESMGKRIVKGLHRLFGL